MYYEDLILIIIVIDWGIFLLFRIYKRGLGVKGEGGRIE